MKRIQDLRQLRVGNVVLLVGYDYANFASNDPGGWEAVTCRVESLGSREFLPRTCVIELVPLDERYKDRDRDTGKVWPWCVVQDQEFVSLPAALGEGPGDEPSFVHNQGMAGDSEVRLFLLQTHGMEEDLDDPDDPRWGEVPESRDIPVQWTVESLPADSWAPIKFGGQCQYCGKAVSEDEAVATVEDGTWRWIPWKQFIEEAPFSRLYPRHVACAEESRAGAMRRSTPDRVAEV